MNDDPQTLGEKPAERLGGIAGEFKELEPRERLELLLEFAEAAAPAGPSGQRGPAGGPSHPGMPDARLYLGRRRGRPGSPGGRSGAEAPTVKGFVSILIDLFSGATVADALALEANVVAQLGLVEALGMMRMRGLQAMQFYIRNRIAAHARA